MFKIFCTYICWIIYKMQHLEVSGAVRRIYNIYKRVNIPQKSMSSSSHFSLFFRFSCKIPHAFLPTNVYNNISSGSISKIWYPKSGIGRVILRVLDQEGRQTGKHTHEYIRIPLDGWSVRRSDLYLRNTQQTREKPTYAFNGFRNRDPSNQVAADLQCVPHTQPISPTYI